MAAEPWADLVSPRVGVVKSLRKQARPAEEPEPPHLYTAQLANFDFRAPDGNERLGAGKGWTPQEAQASAVGEAIERYCAFHWDPDRTFLARVDELEVPAITPADCVLYSEAQYARPDWEYRRFDPGEPVTWIAGERLPGGEPVAMPASLVYLAFPPPRPEDAFAASTSNGLAAGPTLEAATLGGLCEVIERDALMLAWLQRLPATELDLDASGALPAALRRHYAAIGVTLRAFALPTDLPATVVLGVAFEDRPQRPAQVVGMGCHPTPSVALTKALFELCQARPAEAARFRDDPPAGRLRGYEDVLTLDDHSAFAALPEQRDEFAFLWAGGERAAAGELPDRGTGSAAGDVERCAAALDDAGHAAGRVELTTSDVEGRGYRVVRVIAAGLQPIHFGFGMERLGGERLRGSELNPCPHPMA
ncbi:MAG TPA: YcaO-like family protein [Solirubrobacteraceae bacterium]|nr:YcaO-like family protein [Solirubrobacteraceae bacterium]